jgi:hypothetical protein
MREASVLLHTRPSVLDQLRESGAGFDDLLSPTL